MSLDLIELNICFRNTKCTEYFYFFLKNFLNIYFLLFFEFFIHFRIFEFYTLLITYII